MQLTAHTLAVPVAALVWALAAGPADAAFPGRNGLIAFDTADGETSQIHTIAPSGKHLRQLTHGKARRTDPHWSADGSRIAYISDQSGSPQIWVMRRDGSGQHAVTKDPGADYAAASWSPSGNRLVASRCSHLFGTCDIVTLRLDGRGRRRLVGGFWHHGQPSWSPNGRRIAYTSDEGGYDSRLWVARPNGRHRRHITPPVLVADGANWSTDARRIAFTGDPHTGYVFDVAASGGKVNRQPLPANSLFPAYSPDGRKIVVNLQVGCEDCRGLSVASVRGTHPRALKDTRLPGLHWSDWGVAP